MKILRERGCSCTTTEERETLRDLKEKLVLCCSGMIPRYGASHKFHTSARPWNFHALKWSSSRASSARMRAESTTRLSKCQEVRRRHPQGRSLPSGGPPLKWCPFLLLELFFLVPLFIRSSFRICGFLEFIENSAQQQLVQVFASFSASNIEFANVQFTLSVTE